MCTHYSKCQNRVSPLTHIFYAIQTKYPPMYRNDSTGCNSNLEKPHKLNLTFWKAKPQCLSEFKSADPKLTINKHVSKNLKIKIYRTIILPVVLYGCETWSLTLREEHRLGVFENRVLRKVFGPKRDEVIGE